MITCASSQNKLSVDLVFNLLQVQGFSLWSLHFLGNIKKGRVLLIFSKALGHSLRAVCSLFGKQNDLVSLLLLSNLAWASTGLFWPAHAGVAAMAGGSEHAPEEERGRGQAAVGQQTWQTAAGKRGDNRGNGSCYCATDPTGRHGLVEV